MFFVRFIFYFALSFSLLCIPVEKDQLLFNKIFLFVSPYARDVVKTTKQKISTTKRYSKKLYSNSSPKAEEDKVQSQMAGIKKASE